MKAPRAQRTRSKKRRGAGPHLDGGDGPLHPDVGHARTGAKARQALEHRGPEAAHPGLEVGLGEEVQARVGGGARQRVRHVRRSVLQLSSRRPAEHRETPRRRRRSRSPRRAARCLPSTPCRRPRRPGPRPPRRARTSCPCGETPSRSRRTRGAPRARRSGATKPPQHVGTVHSHPARALHQRLDDDACHVVRDRLERPLERVVSGRGHGHVNHRQSGAGERAVHAVDRIAQRHRGERVAVIGAFERHDLAPGPPRVVKRLQRHLEGDLDGHRSALREEDVREVAGEEPVLRGASPAV